MMRKPIPEFEVTMAVRNNRLKARRRALGLTQKEMARRTGIPFTIYGQFERMKLSPFDRQGEWRARAVAIAEFFGESPWELFPDAIVRFSEAGQPSSYSTQLSSAELGLIGPGEVMAQLPSPEDSAIDADLAVHLHKLIETLTPREAQIVRMHFGFDGEAETLKQIGWTLGLCREHVRNVLYRALWKLRSTERMEVIASHLHGSNADRAFHNPNHEYHIGDPVWVEDGHQYHLGRIVGFLGRGRTSTSGVMVYDTSNWFRVRVIGQGTTEVRGSKLSPAHAISDRMEVP